MQDLLFHFPMHFVTCSWSLSLNLSNLSRGFAKGILKVTRKAIFSHEKVAAMVAPGTSIPTVADSNAFFYCVIAPFSVCPWMHVCVQDRAGKNMLDAEHIKV